LLKKDKLLTLFKNKLLLLIIAIVAATIVLAILVQPLSVLIIGIGIPAACIVGIMFFLSWTPPKPIPKPAKLGIKADPNEIVADGKSTSTITIELLDEEGKPMPAIVDTGVRLASTKGRLEKQEIKILKEKDKESTVLISSTETGPVTLSAGASGLKSISVTLNFVEKKRFCMHCGVLIPFRATRCQKCGKAPPAGVDTRVCKNCGAVIPIVAKFCSECGAGQPD
jgi:ribosomal protein L40E